MHQGFIVIHIFEINLSIFEMHINVFVGRKLISGSFDLTHRQTDRQLPEPWLLMSYIL